MTNAHAEDHWDRLSDDDKKSVLRYANLGFGVVLKATKDGTVEAGRPLLELGLENLAKPSYPGGGGYDCKAYDTRAEFYQRDFGLRETKANVGLSGTLEGITGSASGSTSSSTQTERTKRTKKTTYHLYAENLVNKVKLDLKSEMPPLAPGFQEALSRAVRGNGEGVQNLAAVYEVLNAFGWYVPKSVTLGGRLIQTAMVTTDSKTETSRIEKEFSAEFKGSVGVPGAFAANGGGSTHTKDDHETSNTHYASVSGSHRRYVGGSASALAEGGLQAWLDSLDDALEWRVVGIELFPVLSYMPSELLDLLRQLQQAHGAYESVRDLPDVDASRYFTEVEVASPAAPAW